MTLNGLCTVLHLEAYARVAHRKTSLWARESDKNLIETSGAGHFLFSDW